MALMSGRLFRIFLYSFPFVHAFALTPNINIAIVAAIAMAVALPFSGYRKLRPSSADMILLLYLFFMVVSNVLNLDIFTFHTVNHAAAWNVCIFLFLYVPRFYMRSVTADVIFRILTFTYILVTAFLVLEFLCGNFFGVDLNAFMPRPSGREYAVGFMNGFLRSRAFFSESAYAGMYMALIYPFAAYWSGRSGRRYLKNIVLPALTVMAAFTVFSTTYILVYPLACLFVFLLFSPAFRGRVLRFLPLFILFAVIWGGAMISFVDGNILYKFGTNSALERTMMLRESFRVFSGSDFIHMLFGYGTGSYAELNIPPAASVYVNVLRDGGIVGLLSFLAVWVCVFRQLFWHHKNSFTPCLAVSVIMA